MSYVREREIPVGSTLWPAGEGQTWEGLPGRSGWARDKLHWTEIYGGLGVGSCRGQPETQAQPWELMYVGSLWETEMAGAEKRQEEGKRKPQKARGAQRWAQGRQLGRDCQRGVCSLHGTGPGRAVLLPQSTRWTVL